MRGRWMMSMRLSLEAALGPGLHAYAPGAPEEFIQVSWKLAPSPAWKAGEPQWPAAEKTVLFGYDEKVPNYTGTIAVSRELTLAAQAALIKEAPSGTLIRKGEFRYQACNDQLCFPPSTAQAAWTLQVVSEGTALTPVDAPLFARLAFVVEQTFPQTVETNFGRPGQHECATAAVAEQALQLIAPEHAGTSRHFHRQVHDLPTGFHRVMFR